MKAMDNHIPDRETFENPYEDLAKDIMQFMREENCIEAIDLGVYLYRGTTTSQLSAYLKNRLASADYPEPFF